MDQIAPALRFLLLLFTGWANRGHVDVEEYLREEVRVLRELLDGQRLRPCGSSRE